MERWAASSAMLEETLIAASEPSGRSVPNRESREWIDKSLRPATSHRARASGARAVALANPKLRLSNLRNSANHKQRLIEFHRLAGFAEDGHDGAGDVGFDRVEHLHRLDDRHGVAGLDLLTDGDE